MVSINTQRLHSSIFGITVSDSIYEPQNGTTMEPLTVLWFSINTQRLHSSSFLGLPYRMLYKSPKKELLWSLRVVPVKVLEGARDLVSRL